MNNDVILRMENISKSFPGVKALDNVQLTVRKGTINALMGENGAGKSTLMKILNGIYSADTGQITFQGQPVTIDSTQQALDLGISMIHQELSPVPYMTVAENIFLGREPLGRFGMIDKHKLNADTKELLGRLEIKLRPTMKMKDLSVANKQMVEIAKAISYDSSLIIMDEPTSAITEREVAHLFRMIRTLQEKDVAMIYITHKMDEVFQIADDITVLRDGTYVGTVRASESSRDELIAMMVGRELTEMFPKEEAPIGEVALSVRNLTVKGLIKDVSFDVRRGEIFGLAGLMGAGRTEVMETIFGIRKADSGEITIDGTPRKINSPADAIKNGLALLTEDRKGTGIMGVLSVRDNMTIASLPNYEKGPFLDGRQIRKVCDAEKSRLDIKTPSMSQLIKNLSGGNQQKVLVSRWLLTDPEILIVDEPTRGIDVGAKAEIHKLLCKLAQDGKAIIMISSELPEVLGMSDRVLVMHEGKVGGIFDRAEATQQNIMQAATGGHGSLEQEIESEMTNVAQEAAIPLVYVNRRPADLPEGVVFVGSDSLKAGILQAEWLAKALGGQGNVVILQGNLDQEAAQQRTAGVKQVFEQYPDIHIIKEDSGNWSRNQGHALMDNWLASGVQIDAVASNNDEMAIGALRAIEAAGKLGQILVAGVDGTHDALIEMDQGRLNMTIFQNAAGQGESSIKAAIALARGEKIDQITDVPFEPVTPENYKAYMNGGSAKVASAEPNGNKPSSTKPITIGVSVVFDDAWLTTLRNAMSAYAETQAGVTLVMVDSEEKVATQLGQVEEFVTQGVDVIVLIPAKTD
ncbi:MAG: substrate-binding domain-containing protein [Anaerolineaceae bacterium]|nr:substrate-binding domain-containing protein [Anaerolineaceae bacterium]